MIYIKGMDMPVDCLGCWVSCMHETYQVIGRPEGCPLEEAKTGDLISRADAIEAVAQQWLFEASAESPYVNDDDIDDYRKLAEELLSDIPSAEAVQGEWIDIDNYYRLATCSRCHKVTMFEKWGEYTKPYDFCPNCGAKMKGAEHEID